MTDPQEINAQEVDFEAYSFVTLARIYDLLCVIARAVDINGAEQVLDAHERGLLLGAPPALDMSEQ
jgi:hypothetical protein